MSTDRVSARQARSELKLTTALALLMLVQPLLGLLFSDAYRDVAWIKATWFGNDLVTLLLAAPMLVVSAIQMGRGSQRARLVWLGALGYGAYNYAYYLLGAALNAFFPLYVLALVISVVALIVGLAGTDARAIAEGFASRTPVRAIGGYYVFVAVGLSAVWLGAWAAYIFAGRPTPIETEAFKLVAALDMTIMVPAMAFGGVLLWGRNKWGYVISATAGVQGSLYLLVLSVNSFVAIARGLAKAPGELTTWGPMMILTSVATVVLVLCAGRQDTRASS